MLYTALLLADVLEVCESKGYQSPTYGDVGTATFGPSFKSFFEIFCVGEVFFVAVFFLVFVGQGLGHVLHGIVDIRDIMITATAMGMLIFYIPKRYLGFLSVLGIFLTLLALSAILTSGLVLLPDNVNTSQSLLGTVGLLSLPRCVSGLAVAAGDHAVFPSLFAATDASSFRNGLVMAFFTFFITVLVLCVLAYWTFGTSLDTVAVNNIGVDTHGNPDGVIPGSFTLVCNMLLVARTLTVFPNFVTPSIVLFTQFLKKGFGVDFSLPEGNEDEMSLLYDSPSAFFRRFVLVCMVFSTVCFCGVLCADIISELDCLVGSLFKSVNVIIIPCAGYLRVCTAEVATAKRATIFALLILGVLWGAQGTVSFVQTVLLP
eukprot:gnl/TRDRNA2_/TRDRNA2_89274_c0_seq1.p1 gnl/TRDRNA2_/TRDRNA2_89274_c0~~gnl/TRDRNA2_/TRDRNA2_89274_c0_seq1.p1  ORF type:complete len:404 (-),score=49.81 gnl/TRDRNA2_/TRDRNA2_89274_c0_seq1:45-1166(-)